jgi:hypothetical protein
MALEAGGGARERRVRVIIGQQRRLPAGPREPSDERGRNDDDGKNDPLLSVHADSKA